jgi:hypothetical protein
MNPGWLDWLIYRLFFWRWNRIFAARYDLWVQVVRHGERYWKEHLRKMLDEKLAEHFDQQGENNHD